MVGRYFPWGDEFDSTFCRMEDSRLKEQDKRKPEPIGLFPIDESPYGVRDLAGGMREWTSTASGERGELRIMKGGAWSGPSSFCRSGRDAYEPWAVYASRGFRLFARRAP